MKTLAEELAGYEQKILAERAEAEAQRQAKSQKYQANIETVRKFIYEESTNAELMKFRDSLVKEYTWFGYHFTLDNMTEKNNIGTIQDFFDQLFSDATTPDATGKHPEQDGRITKYGLRSEALAQGEYSTDAVIRSAKERKEAAVKILKFLLEETNDLETDHKILICEAFMANDYGYGYEHDALKDNNPELKKYMDEQLSALNKTWGKRVDKETNASVGRT